jgi:8-oxo-dGTP pyrophosphatase MutT (NUDIX family)
VIVDASGRVAVVRPENGTHHLPGGGCDPGESPQQTVAREAIEECARAIAIERTIGEAVQYYAGEGVAYEIRATLFTARFISEADGAGEHELLWLSVEDAVARVYHGCHAWAIEQRAGGRGEA